jgi:hypothetical protein
MARIQLAMRHSTLPPRLREVCAVLALGMLRMRTARLAYEATQTPWVSGESSLHFRPDQSGHALRNDRRDP